VAEIKRLGLDNLNHMYERELNKPDVHQMKGRWNVLKSRETGRQQQPMFIGTQII
jgi:hypothetical protein